MYAAPVSSVHAWVGMCFSAASLDLTSFSAVAWVGPCFPFLPVLLLGLVGLWLLSYVL